MRKYRSLVTLWVAGVIALAACHRGRAPRPTPAAEPTADMKRALDLFHRGEFRRAQTILQRLTFELPPGDPELAEARYYTAESWFQMGDYVQAASDFRHVSDEFSTSEYAPLALLRAGDANLRLWRRPELDPAYGETALAIYQELTGRFPESDAAARARAHVRRLENQFAEKTYKTAVFYVRRKAWDSAIIYFKDVIANYPNSNRAPDALLRLVDSYRAIGYKEELQETCDHLRRFYPKATGLNRECPVLPAADSTRSTSATPSTP
jgi:outer membrane protein assembly factor BamD